jgi:hypothetical protein
MSSSEIGPTSVQILCHEVSFQVSCKVGDLQDAYRWDGSIRIYYTICEVQGDEMSRK